MVTQAADQWNLNDSTYSEKIRMNNNSKYCLRFDFVSRRNHRALLNSTLHWSSGKSPRGEVLCDMGRHATIWTDSCRCDFLHKGILDLSDRLSEDILQQFIDAFPIECLHQLSLILKRFFRLTLTLQLLYSQWNLWFLEPKKKKLKKKRSNLFRLMRVIIAKGFGEWRS